MNSLNLLRTEGPNKTDAICFDYEHHVPPHVQLAIRNFMGTEIEEDLLEMMRAAWQIPNLNKKDPKYKAAKTFWGKVKSGSLKYNFTDEQILEIVRFGPSRKPGEIMRMLFPDEDQRILDGRAASAAALMRATGVEYQGEVAVLEDAHTIEKGDYRPPQSDDIVIGKINAADPSANFVKANLNGHQRKCVKTLRNHLNSLMFVIDINSYKKSIERKLFEQEFIKSVYNKPDMIPDDIAASINLAGLYVRRIQIQEMINLLDNRMKNTLEGDEKTSMVFSEDLKSKTAEMNKCLDGIAKYHKQLNESRSKRMAAESQFHQSLAPYIQKVADENNRIAMLRAAKVYNDQVLMAEINKLSDLPQEIGEIHGISINEILGFKHDILE